MKLSDQELCMLEQLTYLDEDVAEVAGVSADFGKINTEHLNQSIAEILSVFDGQALLRLAAHTESVCDGAISGVEWAQIISYLKDESHNISKLQLATLYTTPGNNYYHAAVFDNGEYVPIAQFRKNNSDLSLKEIIDNYTVLKFPLGLCFFDPAEPEKAVVAYKGTTGQDEWGDNVEAAKLYATVPQHNALDFANSLSELGFTYLTVTGHSKGANKAMFTTILCPNVTRCVCFDGQGFSQEFLGAYKEMTDEDDNVIKGSEYTIEKIAERANLITTYSLKTDFVHILLNQIPGVNAYYTEGYNVDGLFQHHASNSFVFCNETLSFRERLYQDTEMTWTMLHDEDFMNILALHMALTGQNNVSDKNIWDVFLDELYYCGNEMETIVWERLDAEGRNYTQRMLSYCNSMMLLEADEENNGNMIPMFFTTEESDSMTTLHNFVTYLLSLGSDNKVILNFLGELLPQVVPIQTDSGTYSYVDKLRLVMDNKDIMACLIEHLVLFMRNQNLDGDFVETLLDRLGTVDDINKSILDGDIIGTLLFHLGLIDEASGVLSIVLCAVFTAVSDFVINKEENLGFTIDMIRKHLGDFVGIVMTFFPNAGMAPLVVDGIIDSIMDMNEELLNEIIKLCDLAVHRYDYYKEQGYERYIDLNSASKTMYGMNAISIAEYIEKFLGQQDQEAGSDDSEIYGEANDDTITATAVRKI